MSICNVSVIYLDDVVYVSFIAFLIFDLLVTRKYYQDSKGRSYKGKQFFFHDIYLLNCI